MPENRFDERIAERYDETTADLFDPEVLDPAVDFLAELAGDGAALELGVGTGRVALPLAARGIPVHGIDISEAMVARLRGKSGSDRVGVTIGDFATTKVDGTFSLAYLVRNTIMNLTTQAEQVACFGNVADHLEPGGCFVLEVVVPDLRRLPPDQAARAFALTPTYVAFEEFTDLTEAQIAWSHHYRMDGGKLDVFSAPYRYVWPAELDLMARLAGMTLRERWSGWKREPFTSVSAQHVSVWETEGSG